jgi:hypothetical protein
MNMLKHTHEFSKESDPVAQKIKQGLRPLLTKAAIVGAALTFVSEVPSAQAKSQPVRTAAAHESQLDVQATKKIQTFGARIINYVQTHKHPSEGIRAVAYPIPGTNMDIAKITVDVPPTGNQPYDGEYDLSLLITRSRDHKLHPERVTDVYVAEGVKNNLTYTNLQFNRDPHEGGWGIGDTFINSQPQVGEQVTPINRIGATSRRLFGMTQRVLTSSQVTATVNQANSIMSAALRGDSTGPLPPAL